MALTLTLIPGSDSTAYAYDGDTKSKLSSASFELDLGAYVTDGVPTAPADVTSAINGTCSAISAIIFHGPSRDGVHWASYNASTAKILSWTASGTQTANGTPLGTDDKLLYCTIKFS